MDKITLQDKTFKPYLSNKEIISVIEGLADRINADYADAAEAPVILCVLNGAMIFTAELFKRLNFPCTLASLKLSSYVGTSSTGTIQAPDSIHGDIKGKSVLVCEDIVDTGCTIEFLQNYLMQKGAAEVKICTMLFKPEVYTKPIELDYVGKSIPNDFIVGFGLDYNELGRNLQDIYVIDEK